MDSHNDFKTPPQFSKDLPIYIYFLYLDYNQFVLHHLILLAKNILFHLILQTLLHETKLKKQYSFW